MRVCICMCARGSEACESWAAEFVFDNAVWECVCVRAYARVCVCVCVRCEWAATFASALFAHPRYLCNIRVCVYVSVLVHV